MHVLEILLWWDLPQVDSYICYYHFFWSFELYLIISLIPKLSFIFDHLPSTYLLAHNCEISRGSFTFLFVITFVLWSIPFDPYQCSTRSCSSYKWRWRSASWRWQTNSSSYRLSSKSETLDMVLTMEDIVVQNLEKKFSDKVFKQHIRWYLYCLCISFKGSALKGGYYHIPEIW